MPIATESAKAAQYLRTDHLKVGLGARTARGGAFVVGAQGLKFVLTVGSTIVLARLLTPEDYGLIGMVAVVMGFVALFKDLGLATATVQREHVTPAQISTLFWVNMGLSFIVAVVTAALAPVIARFYREPRLFAVTLVYAAGFIMGGLAVQHEALLRRQMRFVALTIVEGGALLTSIAVTVLLAWRGWAYWSLVGGHLALGVAYAAGVWIACGWRPGLPVRGSDVRAMLQVGGNLTGFGVINYFARNLDNMLIGRFWGSQSLGLYAKAYQLLMLPIDQINVPITTVALPALSRLNDDPERYRRAYLRILEKIALVTMPGIAFMIVTADWIVMLVLGPKWIGAARIFAVLGVAALIQPITNTTGWLFISQERTREMLRWGLKAGLLVIAAIIVGLPWGALGVAASYSTMWALVVAPLLFRAVGRRGHVRAKDFYLTVAPAFCAALGVVSSLLLFRLIAKPENPLIGVAASLGIGCGSAILILLALPAGRRVLGDVRATARELLDNAGLVRQHN